MKIVTTILLLSVVVVGLVKFQLGHERVAKREGSVLTPLDGNLFVTRNEELVEDYAAFRKAFIASAESTTKIVISLRDKLAVLSMVSEGSAEVLWVDNDHHTKMAFDLKKGDYPVLVKLATTLVEEARFPKDPVEALGLFSDGIRVYIFVRKGYWWQAAHTLAGNEHRQGSIIAGVLSAGATFLSLPEMDLSHDELKEAAEVQMGILRDWAVE